MAYTEQQLLDNIAVLERALLTSTRSAQFADRAVTYRSTQEIRDEIAYFNALLQQVGKRPRQYYGVTVKGF